MAGDVKESFQLILHLAEKFNERTNYGLGGAQLLTAASLTGTRRSKGPNAPKRRSGTAQKEWEWSSNTRKVHQCQKA
ncbi:hypothetical protein ABIF90_007173 [Bradyrhizobium japonicum]